MPPERPARAVYRDRSPVARPGMVRRLHIVREDPAPGWEPGEQTLCGVKTWAAQNSAPVIIDPMPSCPPEGLDWCPACVGKQAELLGLLGEIAARVAAQDAFIGDAGGAQGAQGAWRPAAAGTSAGTE